MKQNENRLLNAHLRFSHHFINSSTGKGIFIMMDRKIILINTHPYSYADTLILVPHKNKNYLKYYAL